MIYSKKYKKFVPVNIDKNEYVIPGYGKMTRYTVKDNKIPIGNVDLKDTDNGVYVLYIQNKNNELYSGFGKIADQLEVEHCKNRGLDTFEITSEASLNSHVQHYKRGKRFFDDSINRLVGEMIDTNPAGTKFDTRFLGNVKMFMPKELINKYLDIIKNFKLLK